jgi:hypothetical protein
MAGVKSLHNNMVLADVLSRQIPAAALELKSAYSEFYGKDESCAED